MIPGLNNLKTVGAGPLRRAKQDNLPGNLKIAVSMVDLNSPLMGQSRSSFNMNNNHTMTH